MSVNSLRSYPNTDISSSISILKLNTWVYENKLVQLERSDGAGRDNLVDKVISLQVRAQPSKPMQ